MPRALTRVNTVSHFILIFVCAHFCNKMERCQLRKTLKYFRTNKKWYHNLICIMKNCLILFHFHCCGSLQSYYIVPLTIWHQLFLKFWLVYTWFFAHSRDQWAVTRLENVRQLKIRRGKKLSFQFTCTTSKTEKLQFWKSLNYFNILWWKNMWRQIWRCPMEKCLILFHFHCLDLIK